MPTSGDSLSHNDEHRLLSPVLELLSFILFRFFPSSEDGFDGSALVCSGFQA
jgi:hypothetical protein